MSEKGYYTRMFEETLRFEGMTEDDQQIFNDIIGHHTEEDLRRTAGRIGISNLNKLALVEVLERQSIMDIKRQLDEQLRRCLSDEVEDYFNYHRAKFYLFSGGKTFQTMGPNDRAGINMDNAFIHFDYFSEIELPTSVKNGILKKFESKFDQLGDGPVAHFICRAPEEYFKLLIYYAKASSFEDLEKIFDSWEINKEGIRSYGDYADREYGYGYDPVEWIASMRGEDYEWIYKRLNISSVDEYIKLFAETHYSIRFFRSVSFHILGYVFDITGTDSVDKFIRLTENRGLLNSLAGLGVGKYGDTNFVKLMQFFSINDVNTIIELSSNTELINMLKKIPNANLEILLRVSDSKNISDFISKCVISDIKNNMEQVEYQYLEQILLATRLSNYKEVMFEIIKTTYNAELSNACKDFIDIVSKGKDKMDLPEGIESILISILKNGTASNENLIVLSEIVVNSGNSDKPKFERLELLRKFMGGVITPYLSNLILCSDDPQKELETWNSIINSFKDGKFDKSNELHRNLEYKRYLQIMGHEALRKYMHRHYGFEDYMKLFHEEHSGRKYQYHERDKFEIECVAYEAKILFDYILKIKEQAEKIGREVLVIPNLSYGYLPVCPLIDELSKLGIKVKLGVKVGSSECHTNREEINTSLFKGSRTEIIKKQPIIIVVDGTRHLLARDGDGKSSRYPDSYQGYLNQLIAINDAIGGDDVNYEHLGKDDYSMSRLRNNSEFQRTVAIYQKLMNGDNHELYDFVFWNTATESLIIRGSRQEVNKISPFNPMFMSGPTMIFCNVGLYDHQIPQEIKSKYPGNEHIPAYYDDSGRIVNFEFEVSEYGIQYVNSLENKLSEVYLGGENNTNLELNSQMIKFAEMYRGRLQLEDVD